MGDGWLNTSTNRMYQFLALSGAAPQWIEIPLSTTANTFAMNNLTVAGTSTLSGNASALALATTNIAETVSLGNVAIAGPVFNYNVTSQTVYYAVAGASSNFIINIRGADTVTLNSLLNVGQSVTVAMLLTTSSSAYYIPSVQVDGSAPAATKWQGAVAPTVGSTSGIDSYTFSVIKTAASTYTVMAAKVQFA